MTKVTLPSTVFKSYLFFLVYVLCNSNLKNLGLSKIGSRSGCHRCNNVRRADIDDVSISPDVMIQWVEVDHSGKLAFSKHRFQLPHCHRITLSTIKCKVANLKRLVFERRNIMGDTYLEHDTCAIKKILDGPCYVVARMFVLKMVEPNGCCFECEASTGLDGGDPVQS